MKSETEVGKDVDTEFNTLGKQLLNGIESQWKIKLMPSSPKSISVSDLTVKQKDFFRDIFANIPAKRILFQPEKRYAYAQKNAFSEPLVPDAIILPINAQEIQEVLNIAQENDIKISCASQGVLSKNLFHSKVKGYCCISLELMQKTLKFLPEQEQITVQSGLKISQLEQYLKEQSWELVADVKGGNLKTVDEWICQHPIAVDSVSKAVVHTPSGTLQVQKGDALYAYLLEEKKHLGIVSEYTLQIRPLSKYVRKVSALFKDLKSVEEALRKIRVNGVLLKSFCLIHLHENSLVQLIELKEITSSNDLLSSIFKRKNSNEILEEKDWSFRIQFELDEYHFNISAVIVKLKEILQESGAKLISHETMPDFLEEEGGILEELKKYEIDTFHIQKWVLSHQLIAICSELKKQLQISNHYSANKTSYQIIFSGNNSPITRVDVIFIASKKHRKSDDALNSLYSILNEILDSPISRNHLYQDVVQSIQQKLDSKSTMLS